MFVLDKEVKRNDVRQTGLLMLLAVVSGATGEETSDAGPAESGAGGPGDAVSLWAAGPPHQSTDAAGRSTCLILSHQFVSSISHPAVK